MHLASILQRAASLSGDQPALLASDGSHRTWAEVHGDVVAAAAHLVEYGVAPGDRVTAALDNTPEYLVAYFATAWVGAVLAGLGTGLLLYQVA